MVAKKRADGEVSLAVMTQAASPVKVSLVKIADRARAAAAKEKVGLEVK